VLLTGDSDERLRHREFATALLSSAAVVERHRASVLSQPVQGLPSLAQESSGRDDELAGATADRIALARTFARSVAQARTLKLRRSAP
jgi:hypothetical protein